MSESESSHHGTDAVDEPAADLEHVTVENEDAPDACTMYPQSCSDEEMATHWITAHEGSFVVLTEMC